MLLTVIAILVLLAAACWWTLLPMFERPGARRLVRAGERGDAKSPEALRQRDLEAQADGRLLQLKDLEFDRQMNKIDEPEFEQLRRELVREAASIYKEMDQVQARDERRAGAGHRGRGGPGLPLVLVALMVAGAASERLPALSPAPAAAQSAADLPAGHPPINAGAGEAASSPAASAPNAMGTMGAGPAAAGAQVASIAVRVVNGTTDAPGRADQIVLSRLGEGMEQLGSLTNVDGQAVFPPVSVTPDDAFLLQAFAGGVHTNRMVRGGDLLTGPVELTVYEITSDPAGVRIANLNLVFRRLRDSLEVSYLLTVENSAKPPRAIVPSRAGAFALSLPGGAASVARMQINSGLIPIDVSPAAGSAPDEVAFDRTLLPGRSRVDISAHLPYPGELSLPLRISADLASLTIFAFPTDLQISGNGLTADGVEPQTGFLVFSGPALASGQTLDLRIRGGDPEAALAAPHDGTDGGGEADAQPQVRVVEQRPRAAGYAPWLVLGIVLLLGFVAAPRASREEKAAAAAR